MTPQRRLVLQDLEARLGHRFRDVSLLDRALTHTSRANEDPDQSIGHNEALEFLGDAYLGYAVAELLHRRDPDGAEGLKSRERAYLVSAKSLARKAAALGVPELLLLGRGEEKTGGRKKQTLWSDALEAIIAALLLDGGPEAAHRFVERCFRDDLGAASDFELRDAKSALQEALQGKGRPPPEYLVEAEEGPSHRRTFRVRCLIDGACVATGEGPSKKGAQQEAALRALQALGLARGSAAPAR